MREIKFRVKEVSTGLWIIFHIGNVLLTDRFDRETLGEYTGLHDKQGKDIYEGDILRDEYKVKGKRYIDTGRIDFINGCTCLTYFDLDENGQRQYFPAYNGLEHYEVIGNIWEHPELLSTITKSLGKNP